MTQVLDYSAGFPGADAILRAGYAGAVRYIGFPGKTKCTTRREFEDFSSRDIGMALVFENNTTDWRGGYQQGQVSGRRARDHANAIGFPADRPIYMAIDQDVITSGEFSLAVQYLRGANAALGGPACTGVYGEAAVIELARKHEVATWFWQTAAWSRGVRVPAHLFQHVGTVTVGGIGCDINDVLAEDWGQHNYAGGTVSAADVTDALTKTHYPNLGDRSIPDALAEVLTRILRFTDNDVPALKAGLDALSDDERILLAAYANGQSAILSAVAAIPPSGKPSDKQIEHLAAQLREGLGAEIASEVGRRLVTPAPREGTPS